MNRIHSYIWQLLAVICVLSVATAGHAFGFSPVDTAWLTVDVQWMEGFTGHTDTIGGGVLLAEGAAAATEEVKEKAEEGVRKVVQMTDEQFERLLGKDEPTDEDVKRELEEMDDGGEPEERLIIPVDGRDPDIKVTKDRSVDDEAVWAAATRCLNAIAKKDYNALREEHTKMARAGYFGEEAKSDAEERAVMLTSAEGDPFLPVNVLARIEDLMKDFGAARRVCTVLSGLTGTTKIPNVSSRLTAFAVNEASTIKARKANFGKKELDPDKWGVIVPWSAEMDEEIGAIFLQKIAALAAEAFAKREDETVWTADGTASFHSLTGLLNDGNIGEKTLDAGDVSFENFDLDYAVDMRTQVDPLGRGPQSQYVFHHDIGAVLSKIQDAGGYVFDRREAPSQIDGRQVEYTEALPDLGEDAPAKSFGVFGDHRFVTIGFQRNMTAKLLSEATIQDVDDSSLIRLASQDSLAIRFTALWDVSFGITQAFSKVTTAAS